MELRKSIEKAKKMRQRVKHLVFNNALSQGTSEEEAEWISLARCEIQCVELDREKASENRCVCILPDAPELELYKVLRAQIQRRCKENGWNTVMITSALPGEGKTLTSINLALTFAKEFARAVLLVDCDLKRQSVYKYLSFSTDRGMIDNLVDDVPLEDLIIWPGVEKLSVISGGRAVYNSTELLSSSKMSDAIVEMKKLYNDRYVFFDAPPILSGADAIAFSPLVDCILMVVQAEKTTSQEIRNALEMIPKDKFLGFVLNRQSSSFNGYYSRN